MKDTGEPVGTSRPATTRAVNITIAFLVAVSAGDTTVRVEEDGAVTINHGGQESTLEPNYIFDETDSSLVVEYNSETSISIIDVDTDTEVTLSVLDGQLVLSTDVPDDVTSTGGVLGGNFNYGLPVDTDNDPSTPPDYQSVADDYAEENLGDADSISTAIEDI